MAKIPLHIKSNGFSIALKVNFLKNKNKPTDNKSAPSVGKAALTPSNITLFKLV